MSAKEKLIDAGGTAPAGIHKEFSATFLSAFPGTDAAWAILGVIEAAAFALFAASLLRGEFLPQRPKPVLLLALATIDGDLRGAGLWRHRRAAVRRTASLFAYFAATAILLVITLLMPPYRPGAWLSSLLPQRDRAVRGSSERADGAAASA